MRLTVVEHPLAAVRLATLRDASTDSARFRWALSALGSMLVYEACRTLDTEAVTVQTPLGPAPTRRLAQQPLLVAVLRAGMGLLQPALELLPDADVAFIGVTRDETSFEPREYVVKVPDHLPGRPCIILDPMLATGGSLVHTAQVLVERGVNTTMTVVCVLAAPEGLARLEASGLDLHVVTASVDSHLDEQAFIVPGLGDAGDRQFGRPVHQPERGTGP